MNIQFDPNDNEKFWQKVSQIPGFPKEDQIALKRMIFEPGALFQLDAVLREAGAKPEKPLLVVMDATPMRRGHEDLKELVLATLVQAGWTPEKLVLAPDQTGQVHTDMPHILAVKAHLTATTSVLSVGSGVVTDVAKHASYLFEQDNGTHVPFVVYQTANSVSAYASDMAPVFVDGVKRTLASRYPDGLVADLETLRDAPKEMTVAGVGDLLAAFISFPDWFLAQKMGFDPHYNQLPQTLMGPLDEIFLAEADGIRKGDLGSTATLAKLITLGGLAMSLGHATTPLSGFEHVMSHVLDMINENANLPFPQHGTQVALSSVIGAEVYRRFLTEFEPAEINLDQCYPSAEKMEQKVLESYAPIDPSGNAGRECWADYRIKLDLWRENRPLFESFLKEWPEIRKVLSAATCPPERLITILKAIDGPLNFAEMQPPASESKIKTAFMNASLMRRRLTIGDFLIFLNWDREQLWREVWTKTQSMQAG